MADIVPCICGKSAFIKKGTDYFAYCECGWASDYRWSAEEAVASWNDVMSAARAVRLGHCIGCMSQEGGTHYEGTYEHPEVPR